MKQKQQDLTAKLKDIIRPKTGYDLFLIEINETNVDAILEAHNIKQIPILIKFSQKGRKPRYHIYGYSKMGELQAIKIDANCTGLKDLEFTNLTLQSDSKSSHTQINQLKAADVPSTLYKEISAKKGHFPKGCNDILSGFFYLDDKERLHYTMGGNAWDYEEKNEGLQAELKDFNRGLTINNKSYPIYVMWQEWLLTVADNESHFLSDNDKGARNHLKSKKTFSESAYKSVEYDYTAFEYFLKREFNLNETNSKILDLVAKKYVQGALTCNDASRFSLAVSGLANQQPNVIMTTKSLLHRNGVTIF